MGSIFFLVVKIFMEVKNFGDQIFWRSSILGGQILCGNKLFGFRFLEGQSVWEASAKYVRVNFIGGQHSLKIQIFWFSNFFWSSFIGGKNVNWYLSLFNLLPGLFLHRIPCLWLLSYFWRNVEICIWNDGFLLKTYIEFNAKYNNLKISKWSLKFVDPWGPMAFRQNFFGRKKFAS